MLALCLMWIVKRAIKFYAVPSSFKYILHSSNVLNYSKILMKCSCMRCYFFQRADINMHTDTAT